jgi:hypothetical protein
MDKHLEHLFSYTVTLAPPEVIGPVPEGIRVNFYVTEGTVHGPKVKGKFLPVGGDWLTVRTDGVGILDVRATIQSQDGALIYVTYGGVGDLGPDGYNKFLQQDLPAVLHVRVAPRFQTAHPEYQWLTRYQCVGIGQVDMARLEVSYDIYALQ